MAGKCVHKGCGKLFTDADEPCVYHSGAPIFHEGQKGWRCCKTRVLTFDEFLTIPPCTTGKHSLVDDTPPPETSAEKKTDDSVISQTNNVVQQSETIRAPVPVKSRFPQANSNVPSPTPSPAPPESDSDDPSIPLKENMLCRRKACGKSYQEANREGEICIHHPGRPLFHEGSKGWTCCKRKVLEFDEFMKIEGCTEKKRHLFVGSGKKKVGEDIVETVRNDFYQTGNSVIVSYYLKKINRDKAIVKFSTDSVELDLPTTDSKRHTSIVPLYGPIDPEKSSFKIMGTKLELNLAKADGQGWPVLRSDQQLTGEIIQVGRAGVAG